jgi:hypothetical protein
VGNFYSDINAAFLDCLDDEGVLQNRQEEFFTSPLAKICNSTLMSMI